MKNKLKIHSENILPIIKQWLYTDRDIFVRELISNSCDALSKRKMAEGDLEAPRIDVHIDKEKKQITISDNGIGMTADEVEKYIAQLAFSGAEEFIEKYEKKEEIIGHFGLGFYSSFMVSDLVTIDTLSYQEGAKAAFWSSDGNSEYELTDGKRETVGTTITLHIGEDSAEFLEETRLQQILNRHCLFLPYPIFLGETQINEKSPLYIKPASECTDEEYIDFYRHLHPTEPDPIFWIHLNVDYPFNLKGILYFPKITRHFDFNKSNIKLFSNRVFVSDNCNELLPDFLTFLRGALDSPDIPLNVSRSALQMDSTVRSLAAHISKKVADRLSSLHTNDKETFLKHWPDIELIIKLGALQDEKFFERIEKLLVWKTSENEWITVDEYPEKTLLYTADEHSPLLEMYKEKNLPVLIAGSHLDSPLFNAFEKKKNDLRFRRIDSHISDELLDKSREKTVLDEQGKTEAGRIADFFRSKLDGVEIEAKSLARDDLPTFVMIDENMRRLRDYMALSKEEAPEGLPTKQTLVVNTNNKLVTSLPKLNEENPDLAKGVAEHLRDLALLAQKELDPSALAGVVSQSTSLLERALSRE